MIEFYGLIAPYIAIIRSNQTTESEKRSALEAMYVLAHSACPQEYLGIWLMLDDLTHMTGVSGE